MIDTPAHMRIPGREILLELLRGSGESEVRLRYGDRRYAGGEDTGEWGRISGRKTWLE